jgi:hypothetical protein
VTSVSTTSPRPGVRLAGLADLATPARLRILNVAIGVALAVVALVWLDSMAVRLDRIDSGREAAEGVRQLQSVRDALVRADSLATAGFLEAGLDDPTRRAAYVDALDQAALELTTRLAARRGVGRDAARQGVGQRWRLPRSGGIGPGEQPSGVPRRCGLSTRGRLVAA